MHPCAMNTNTKKSKNQKIKKGLGHKKEIKIKKKEKNPKNFFSLMWYCSKCNIWYLFVPVSRFYTGFSFAFIWVIWNVDSRVHIMVHSMEVRSR